jgi:hypothetical protein
MYRPQWVKSIVNASSCDLHFSIQIQMGPKVTPLVARSSCGRCAQHLRRIADVTRASGVDLVHMSSKSASFRLAPAHLIEMLYYY